MSRLTARTENGNAYLVNVKPDEQEVDSPHKNTLQCILDCFERLAQYEDLEEQGRLVVLPCKVGDTVWTRGLIACADCPNGTKPAKICGKTGCPLRPMPMPFRVGMFDNIGKTVFLTRAQAEDALARKLDGGGQDEPKGH